MYWLHCFDGGLIDATHSTDFPSDEWLNRVAMMGSCVVVIYPVTLLRNISALRITSFVSVIAIMFLAGAIIDKSIRINENFVPANATSHHGSGSHKFLPVEDPVWRGNFALSMYQMGAF